jgi:hypothetical protein
MQENSSAKNGTGGKTVSAHFRDTKTENAPAGGPDFPWGEIHKRTESTCERIVAEKFHEAKQQFKDDIDRILRPMNALIKYMIAPLLAALCSISIFIFSLMYNQLTNLNLSVQALNQTIATIAANLHSIEKDSEENKRAIEKVEDRIYQR